MNYLITDHRLLKQEYSERLAYDAQEHCAHHLPANQPGFLHSVGKALVAAGQKLQAKPQAAVVNPTV